MIEIKKGVEPQGLAALREKAISRNLNPAQSYELLNRKTSLKREVKKQLVKEQGSLCAYCMCRIPRNDLEENIAPITIEHVIPRNPEDGRDVKQGLDYNNLVAVCSGNRGKHGSRTEMDLTCDAHRGNKEFRRVDPCNAETLKSIVYTLDGKIGARDPDVNYDLVHTLNLNSKKSPLPAERKAALDSLINNIEAISVEMAESAELEWYCQSVLESFYNESEEKTPYSGILIWYLESLLENLKKTI